MKAYVLNRIGCLDLMDVPEPMLKDGEVLVEVKAAGICGSDIPRIFANGTYHFPTIPGHEFAGVVCKVKDKENEGLIGKRVGSPAERVHPARKDSMRCVCIMIIWVPEVMVDLQNMWQCLSGI